MKGYKRRAQPVSVEELATCNGEWEFVSCGRKEDQKVFLSIYAQFKSSNFFVGWLRLFGPMVIDEW